MQSNRSRQILRIEIMNVSFELGLFQPFLVVDLVSTVVQIPEINLFLWALLMNRIPLAKLFWKLSEVIFFIII
jgi:hypothetical protein